MNFEIETDAGCDYECMIDKPHQHILIIDTTPPSPLEAEMTRMQRELRYEAYKAQHGRYPDSILDHLYMLSPTDTPFLSTVGTEGD